MFHRDMYLVALAKFTQFTSLSVMVLKELAWVRRRKCAHELIRWFSQFVIVFYVVWLYAEQASRV